MLKKLYKQACDIEREILASVEKWTASGSATVLYDNPEFPPRYLSATQAPQYIRHIVSVDDDTRYAQILDKSKAMSEYYKQYVITKAQDDPKAFKTYPRRFVHCVKDVLAGRIVEKQSTRQESDKNIAANEMLPLISTRSSWDRALSKDDKLKELHLSAEKLNSLGIQAHVTDGILYASALGIRKYAGASGLSIRTPSGTQYRIHLKFMDPEIKALAMPLGFIVTNSKFPISSGFKEKHNRKNIMENISTEIKLPIYIGAKTIWHRNDDA